MVDFESVSAFGVIKKKDTNTGNASAKKLFGPLERRPYDGTAVEVDNKAEWILRTLVVELSVNGTFKLVDAASAGTDLTNTYTVIAGEPFTLPVQVSSGRGKGIYYTTTGGGDVKIEGEASPMRYSHAKIAKAEGTE